MMTKMADHAPTSAALAAEIERMLGEHAIAALYRASVRPLRTRRFQLNAPPQPVPVDVQHTLLGIELKIGKRRLQCPDVATARFLAVFARLGVAEVAVPYDITRMGALADALEAAWFRLTAAVEAATAGRSNRLRARVLALLCAEQRRLIAELGAGADVPQFNQNTKQRKR